MSGGRPPKWLMLVFTLMHPVATYRAWKNGNL